MSKAQEVDQPEHQHPGKEGVLTDEEEAEEDDGEEEAEDWHHNPELEIVHQYSTHYNTAEIMRCRDIIVTIYGEVMVHVRNLERQFVTPLSPPIILISCKWYRSSFIDLLYHI